MEVVKKVGNNTIIKKKSGRFGVLVTKSKSKKWINGEEKAKILAEAGLIKVSVKQEAPVEEAPAAEESAPEATEE